MSKDIEQIITIVIVSLFIVAMFLGMYFWGASRNGDGVHIGTYHPAKGIEIDEEKLYDFFKK